MFLRIVLLVTFVTITEAGPYGKPTLNAVAEGSYEAGDDGEGYQISLDGSKSARTCANAKWELVSGPNNPTVLAGLSDRIVAEHDVPAENGTYTFMLTIYDPEIPDRMDTDNLTITINVNDPCTHFTPTAKITKESQTKYGDETEIKLNAHSSEYCDTYEWHLITADGEQSLGTDPVLTHRTTAFGEFEFKLTCINSTCGSEDTDHECVTVEDPCAAIDPRAMPSITNVAANDGEYTFTLSASQSTDCDSFEWFHVRESGDILIGPNVIETFTVSQPGPNEFKLICKNAQCHDNTATVHYDIKDPCDDVDPMVSISSQTNMINDKEARITLTATGEDCSVYEWELVGYMTAGTGRLGNNETIEFTVQNSGDYKVVVKCTNPACNKYDVAIKDVCITIPCNNIDPQIHANLKKTEEEGAGWRIYLTASQSDCETYKWYKLGEDKSTRIEELGTEIDQDYYVEQEGDYYFEVTCNNDKCDKMGTDNIDVHVQGNPVCDGITVDAKAAIKEVTKVGDMWNIVLTAEGSQNCQYYYWTYMGSTFTQIGDDATVTYPASSPGLYRFQLLCRNEMCDQTANDYISHTIEDPCKDTEPSVTGDATYAEAGDEYKVSLTATGNEFCKSYEWQHIGYGSDEEIEGEGSDRTLSLQITGFYEFKVTCIDDCGKHPSAIVSIMIPNRPVCKKPQVTASSKWRMTKKGKYIITLTAEGKRCDKYEWYLAGKNIGQGQEIKRTVPKFGDYKFEVKCFNVKCQTSDDDITQVYIADPCRNVDPDVKAKLRKVVIKDNKWKIYLKAEGNDDCDSYQWFLINKKKTKKLKKLGTGKRETFTATRKGVYTFKVVCYNKECDEKSGDILQTKCLKKYTCKGVDSKAKATIKNVEKDGKEWVVTLSSKGSKDCQSYKWKLISEDGSETIGTKKTEKFRTSKPGKYRFSLTCKHEQCEDSAMAFTDERIKNPCRRIKPEVDAKAKYIGRKKGKYVIKLSAKGNKFCKSYKWKLIKRGKDEKIGNKDVEKYSVNSFGKYEFRVICDAKCDKKARATATIEIDDPCKSIDPEVTSASAKIKRRRGKSIIKLKAEGKKCDVYKWMIDGGEMIGKGAEIEYEAKRYGEFSFKVRCIHTKCKKRDSYVVEKYIPDPCQNIDPDVNAKLRKVVEDGDGWKIYMTAKESESCDEYQWYRITGSGKNKKVEKLGKKVDQSYKTKEKKEHKFKVTCLNKKCNDKSRDILETDPLMKYTPCKGIDTKAKASISSIRKRRGNWEIKLSAKGSKNCQKYIWKAVDEDEDVLIGKGKTETFITKRPGSYKFKLLCRHEDCKDASKDFTDAFIKNPCKSVDPEVTIKGRYIQKAKDNILIKLKATGNKYCKSYTWERVKRGRNDKLGEGKDDTMKVKMSKGGRYKFRVTCHTKCKKTSVAQTTVKVVVIDPCDSVEPEVTATIKRVNKKGKKRIIKLIADGRKCSKYEWKLVGGKKFAEDAVAQYETEKYGETKLRVTCINKKCNKKATDVVDYFLKDPCRDIDPKVRGELVKVKNYGKGWKIFLTAKNSDDCDTYQWYRLSNNKKKVLETLGTKITEEFKTMQKGEYTFKVTCTNKRCGSKSRDTIPTECMMHYTPCKGVKSEARATANVKKVKGRNWKIHLSAKGSKYCQTYKWILVGEDKNTDIGNDVRETYKTSKPGNYKFKLTCKNQKCDDQALTYAYATIKNPCRAARPSVEASVKYTNKGKKGYKVKLSASGSKECKSYEWEQVMDGKNKDLGTGSKLNMMVSKHGHYEFKVTCKGKCGKTATAITDLKIRRRDPCKSIKPTPNIKIKYVKEQKDNKLAVRLSAAGSQQCDMYTWEAIMPSGERETIGEGVAKTYIAETFGEYKFKVICENTKCKGPHATVIERVLEDPCGKKPKAKIDLVEVKRLGRRKWRIFLTAKNSDNCKKWRWQLIKKKKSKDIGSGVSASYTAKTTKGSYKFRVVCEDKCGNDSSAALETECMKKYK